MIIVGILYLFEASCRLLNAVRILVRMPLQRGLAVALLDLICRGFRVDAQKLVIARARHRVQQDPQQTSKGPKVMGGKNGRQPDARSQRLHRQRRSSPTAVQI